MHLHAHPPSRLGYFAFDPETSHVQTGLFDACLSDSRSLSRTQPPKTPVRSMFSPFETPVPLTDHCLPRFITCRNLGPLASINALHPNVLLQNALHPYVHS